MHISSAVIPAHRHVPELKFVTVVPEYWIAAVYAGFDAACSRRAEAPVKAKPARMLLLQQSVDQSCFLERFRGMGPGLRRDDSVHRSPLS